MGSWIKAITDNITESYAVKTTRKKGGKERWGNDNEPTQQGINSTHDNINKSLSAADPSDVTYLLSQCELPDRLQQRCPYSLGPEK